MTAAASRIGRYILSLLGLCIIGANAFGSDDATKIDPGRAIVSIDGSMTVERAATILGRQSNADIRVEECIRNRQVTLAVVRLPLADALSSLAALYDWRIVRSDDNSYRILLPAVPAVIDIKEMHGCLRRAVPIDLQAYAGYRDKATFDRTELPLIGKNFAGSGYVDIKQLRSDKLDIDKKQLFLELQDSLKTKNGLPYSKITSDQQHMLLRILLLDVCRTVWSDTTLTDPMPTNLLDPRNTAMKMGGSALMHGYLSTSDSGSQEFRGDGEPVSRHQ